MTRIIPTSMTARRMRQRARLVPILSTMVASLVVLLLPVIAAWPWLPPLGLLLLLGWRLLRPELWAAWVALPLGLFDDLASGQPPGTAALLWTATFIAIDVADRWIVWRDAKADWALAGAGIAFVLAGQSLVTFASGVRIPIVALVPQLAASVLLFPLVQRLCAALDRWRLMR